MSRKPASPPNNLSHLPGVCVTVSVGIPSGGAARDPSVLLNDSVQTLDGRALSEFIPSQTYDTYDGQNRASGADWYALKFPEAIWLNCINMTMGFAYPDGGWWTTLSIEVQLYEESEWMPIEPLTIRPQYDFTDARGTRRPYETHAILFSAVKVRAIRLIGHPGGIAQFTSLARLAAYHYPSSLARPDVPPPPIPYIFQLISPKAIWELSEHLMMLSGLSISFPLVTYYWDAWCFEQYLQRIQSNYQGEPDLWFLVNDTLGWNDVTSGAWAVAEHPGNLQTPYICTRHIDVFSTAVAPVMVEGASIGNMLIDGIIIKDTFDLSRHRALAQELRIDWSQYEAALARSPHLTLEQLRGAVGLMGVISNTIANLAHRNLALENELNTIRQTISQKARYRHEIVRRAIQFMKNHLEDDIGVSDAANAVGLSSPHFNRLFVSEIGRSPGDFLIDLRLERAKEYLTHSDMSVMDVCVALAYSPSYFSRIFKQRVGCTPGEYAARHRTI